MAVGADGVDMKAVGLREAAAVEEVDHELEGNIEGEVKAGRILCSTRCERHSREILVRRYLTFI